MANLGFGEDGSVHELFQAAHVPTSHRSYALFSKEEVFHITELAWLRTMHAVLKNRFIGFSNGC